MDANIYLKDSSGNVLGSVDNPLVVYPATGSFDIVSPLTTKGDLLTYTTTNTRLAVATDNYLLIAASAETEGIKWAQLSDINGVTCSGTSTDNSVVRFHSTTGKVVQWSPVSIDDNGAITTPAGYGIGIGVAPSYLLHINGTTNTDLPTYSAEFLDADNWTHTGTATEWNGSFATGWQHYVGNTATLSHDHNAVNATKYQIAYTVTGRTAGTFTITFGGQTSSAISATGAWGPVTTGTGVLQITPTTDFNGTIVISIKSVTGTITPVQVLTDSAGNIVCEMRAGNVTSNTFLGLNAGRTNSTGYSNTFLGVDAGRTNSTGYYNTFLGEGAGYTNSTGTNNTFLGVNAGRTNSTGYYNTFLGLNAGSANSTGYNNTFLGMNAGYTNSTGYTNTFIGVSAGRTNSTGYSNTFIGYYAGYNANQLTTAQNSMGLGANTFTTRNNQIVIGNASVVETQLRTGVYIGSTSTTAHTQPTARLHIAAGSASAGTAPIKLTAGALNTATEDGTFEYDGTNLYFSIGATRRTVTVT